VEINNGGVVFVDGNNVGKVGEPIIINNQAYVVDDLNNLSPRLVTGSCWTSLITASAGSSTNIV
jgi:hypothetical protein